MVVKELWMKFNCSLSTQGRKKIHIGQVFSHPLFWIKTKKSTNFFGDVFLVYLFIYPTLPEMLPGPTQLFGVFWDRHLFGGGYPWNSPRQASQKQNKKYVNNPFEKYSSNWIISPGMKINDIWNHHLENLNPLVVFLDGLQLPPKADRPYWRRSGAATTPRPGGDFWL